MSLKFMVKLFFLLGISLFADNRCKDPSKTYPVKEDFNDRINFICKEKSPLGDECENVAGTYSLYLDFDSSHCGVSFTPKNEYVVYVTQKGCSITVSYEDGINPDTGDVQGSTATFSGTSLIGDITDIHTISVTRDGTSISGTGSSTLSGPSMPSCIINKTVTGRLVTNQQQ